jgi:DNA polymerase V
VFVVHAQRVPDKVYSPQTHYAFTRLQVGTALTPVLIKQALPLVEALFCEGNKYLKAGVILSHITPEAALQTNLFESNGSPNDRKLMDAVDNINFGIRSDLLKYGSSGTRRDWKMRQELRSKRFTTKWDELMEVR